MSTASGGSSASVPVDVCKGIKDMMDRADTPDAWSTYFNAYTECLQSVHEEKERVREAILFAKLVNSAPECVNKSR